ncbi:MAG TPA: two-component regulator propeller domain-containing protein [Flavobacteriales bacterium]|nr:two-component regulator propeller domain-containing protein [Flavobacteriales bacterium]
MSLLAMIALVVLQSACSGNRVAKSSQEAIEINLSDAKDTLKFTSGIRSIFQDSKGNYWFGSHQEGVCKYDGKTFSYYTTENGLCGNQVITIGEDETGTLWFGTGSGLCSYDGTVFTTATGSSDFPKIRLNNSENSSFVSTATDLWFAGENSNEIIRIDKGRIHKIHYPLRIPAKWNEGDYGITGFSKSNKGGLWIAHYSGVAYFDGNAIQFLNDSTMHFDGESKYMHVRSILEDSKGRLWIGNNGIGVQLKEKDSIIHFSEKFNLFKGEAIRVKSPAGTLMHVFAIHEDSKGNIWFGDRDTGIWRYDGKEMKNFYLDFNLNTQHIWDIYEDRSGNLLFASADRGVFRYNGNGFDRVF